MRGEEIAGSWEIRLPRDGYLRLADLVLSLEPDDPADRKRFDRASFFRL